MIKNVEYYVIIFFCMSFDFILNVCQHGDVNEQLNWVYLEIHFYISTKKGCTCLPLICNRTYLLHHSILVMDLLVTEKANDHQRSCYTKECQFLLTFYDIWKQWSTIRRGNLTNRLKESSIIELVYYTDGRTWKVL